MYIYVETRILLIKSYRYLFSSFLNFIVEFCCKKVAEGSGFIDRNLERIIDVCNIVKAEEGIQYMNTPAGN